MAKETTGILKEIVEYKREFVAQAKREMAQRDLESKVLDLPETRGFHRALTGEGCSLIAEVKTASPSRGLIRSDVGIEDIARIYSENGATCISVLTDEKYFQGSLDRLQTVRNVSALPLLRKDFFIDAYQIFEARAAGADAILLIASCLELAEMEDFIEIAALLDMDCLVEVHDEEEMNGISSLNTGLIGINNRNLNTFTTDIARTSELAALAPKHAVLVSESGIFSADDVRRVHAMGASAVLVGEAIMKERDMGLKARELAEAVK